jgi:transcription elongation GreA/GreB family factor
MDKDLIILEDDKQWARQRIAQLDAEIQALGPEFYDVFNQSSETWHDNAPFDALRDRQSVLDAERQQLRSILRAGLPALPRQKRNAVGIGSTVVLSGKVYFIAGDWTPFAGQIKDGRMIISCNAPLAKKLMNKKVGDKVTIGKKELQIDSFAY